MLIETDFFLSNRSDSLVLDVRSPEEYRRGHIPGAESFPLFSDAERAEVGTLYVRHSRQAAVERGLEFVGPRMAEMVREARSLAAGRDIILYCWRGGMRSESVAWLLSVAGLRIRRLRGGYKAYRRHFPDILKLYPWRFIVLGGYTGSWKTPILNELSQMGEQVIDLEGLANHKGSAFGALGQEQQPTTEHFMNLLHDAVSACDPGRPIWVESESKTIGRVFLPDDFYKVMHQAPLIELSVPRPVRIAHIAKEYGVYDVEALANSFEHIARRMGGAATTQAITALKEGRLEEAVSLALDYYDKAYAHSLAEFRESSSARLAVETDTPHETAIKLLELSHIKGLQS